MTISALRRLPAPVRLGLPLVAAVAAAAACGGGGDTQPASTGPTGTAGTGNAAVITTTNNSAGTFLTDGSGRAVYLWVADGPNRSTCSGACASAWPPVTSHGAPTAAGAAVATDLGTITRSDGSTQVTYDGHPLYYFAGDSGAGQTNGQGSDGFGARWWLVAPSGAQVTGTPSAAPAAGNGGSGGGYGY